MRIIQASDITETVAKIAFEACYYLNSNKIFQQ